jgi:antitoxin (DNA-binding transcriptional repressor) of toxin-antitoxin stability system
MARRKRELLDLLRERANQKDSARSAEASKPTAEQPSAPVPSQSESQKPRPSAPSTPNKTLASAKPVPAPRVKKRSSEKGSGFAWFAQHRTPVLAAVGLLVLVGALKFWPASTPAEAGEGKGGNDSQIAAATEPFAILVATYQYNEKNVPLAQATGRAVRDLFRELAAPKLIIYPQQKPEVIELWIGEAEDKTELSELLRRVQESQVSTDKNNPRPFASARIERRRNINSD